MGVVHRVASKNPVDVKVATKRNAASFKRERTNSNSSSNSTSSTKSFTPKVEADEKSTPTKKPRISASSDDGALDGKSTSISSSPIGSNTIQRKGQVKKSNGKLFHQLFAAGTKSSIVGEVGATKVESQCNDEKQNGKLNKVVSEGSSVESAVSLSRPSHSKSPMKSPSQSASKDGTLPSNENEVDSQLDVAGVLLDLMAK